MQTSQRKIIFSVLLLAAPSWAQDSVGKIACQADSPVNDQVGDGVRPWTISEQKNNYVVDLTEFFTSWGTRFGIAPIIKSSKTNEDFFGSFISAQGLSRRQLPVATFGDTQYGFWQGPGFGINNDATLNDVPGTLHGGCLSGHQFGAVFAEFATTDGIPVSSYNGLIGAMIRQRASRPGRLFVSRIQAATNSCSNGSNISQFGVGGVDEDGNIHFRGDGFGVTGGCAGLSNLTGENLFRVNMARRDASKLNVVSGDFISGGMFDKGTVPATTEWLVRSEITLLNTPGIGPASVFGAAMVLSSNFISQFMYGLSFPLPAGTSAHLAPGVTDHRGNIGYTSENCANLSSTHGIAGILGRDDPTFTQVINVFGLTSSAGITGTKALTLPVSTVDNVVDPQLGVNLFTATLPPPAGENEFDHYHSQVRARGGNSQVALGVDQQGRLLAAAQGVQPDYLAPNTETNFIAVARLNCATGAVEWTLAGYNFNGNFVSPDPNRLRGKAILNGPGGAIVARMTTLDLVTGANPIGPSVSAPMIDSVGNVWFLSAIEYCIAGVCDGITGPFDTALLRAVYIPATFGYQLELVFALGDIFPGQNSGRNWQSILMLIADSNSVDSGTAWSGNMSEVGHLNQNTSGMATSDPRTLGGVIISARILYDADNDGDYNFCLTEGADQEYRALLYVGSLEPLLCSTNSDCNDGDMCGPNICAPAHMNADAAGCVYPGVYGDLEPSPVPDGIVDVDDLICELAGFSNPLDCPQGDIFPCSECGNGQIDVDDLIGVLTAFAGDPCPCQ